MGLVREEAAVAQNDLSICKNILFGSNSGHIYCNVMFDKEEYHSVSTNS